LYISGAPGEEIRSLRGFQRIHLRAGESREVRFTLVRDEIPGSRVKISVGGGQPLAGITFIKGTL